MKPLKTFARKTLKSMGYETYNLKLPNVFSEDGLTTYHNHSFTEDPAFLAAYGRSRQVIGGADHHIRWRAHVAFWAAGHAARLPGAFVECGVASGFLMAGIMQRTDWNALGKHCYLCDTFAGLDPRYVSDHEAADGRLDRYSDLRVDKVTKEFEEFERVHFVVGPVPDTLPQVEAEEICYLSIDMNATVPEIAALRHFWPKLTPGGMVVLDDYSYSGYEEQHFAFNALAEELGFSILCLPTGQGLIMKPVG